MYSYQFTTDNINRALKEIFNDDSTIIQNSFLFICSEEKAAGGIESIYEINTKGGNKYRIITKEKVPTYHIPLKKFIRAIQKIE